MSSIKKVTDYETFNDTPFRVSADLFGVFPYINNRTKEREWKNSDKQKCIKVYVDMHSDLEDLSAMGLKVLSYIFSEMSDESDEVMLRPKYILDYINRSKYGVKPDREATSEANVYRGIADLLSMYLIARKTGHRNVYYINPGKFFKGNRASWFDRVKDVHIDADRMIFIDKRLNK